MAEKVLTEEEIRALIDEAIAEKTLIMRVTPAWEILFRGMIRRLRDPATACVNIEPAHDRAVEEASAAFTEGDWKTLSEKLDELRLLDRMRGLCEE